MTVAISLDISMGFKYSPLYSEEGNTYGGPQIVCLPQLEVPYLVNAENILPILGHRDSYLALLPLLKI